MNCEVRSEAFIAARFLPPLGSEAALAQAHVARRCVGHSAAMNLSDFSPEQIAHLNGLEPHLRGTILGQDHIHPRVASVLHRG